MKPIYRQLGLPVLQNVSYASRSEAFAAPLGDVELRQDSISGLVHNARFDPAKLLYDENYQNEQAASARFRAHLADVLGIVQRQHAAGSALVEIGCGKGYFLEMMQAAGIAATGYDTAYEGSNPAIEKAYLESTAGAEFFVLRHVLEHIPGPFEFLASLARTARPGTKLYIEVPCFDWIVDQQAFYDVFYEHCNYFTLPVLRSAFGHVVESGHLFDGQYLYLIVDLSTFRQPAGAVGRSFEPLEFDALIDRLGSMVADHPPAFIWGAGAKGMTFANIMHRKGLPLTGLIDLNPAKQGRFIGLSGLPILSPQVAMSQLRGHDVFAMNPAYLDEIRSALRGLDARLISVAPSANARSSQHEVKQ